jgi:hypothetical protein
MRSIRQRKLSIYTTTAICVLMAAMLAGAGDASVSAQTSTNAFYAIRLSSWGDTWGLAYGSRPGKPVSGYLRSSESGVGSVKTPVFTVSTPKIRLVLRGWDGPNGGKNENRVELVDAGTGNVIAAVKPPLSDNPVAVNFDAAHDMGKKVFLAFIDGDSDGGYAWIGVDEIDAGAGFHVDFSQNVSPVGWQISGSKGTQVEKGGVPFLEDFASAVPADGQCSFRLGFKAQRLFLLGMTGSLDQGCPCWEDPRIINNRFWVGDRLGVMDIKYADGVTQTYPLVLGDDLWWGSIFANNSEPFASDPHAGQVLKDCLNLYPQGLSPDGKYVAVISPRNAVIDSIQFKDSRSKAGVPVILGLTAQTPPAERILSGSPLPSSAITPDMQAFIGSHSLKPQKADEAKLQKLRSVLYVDQAIVDAHKSPANPVPAGYQGPRVLFKGNVYADILTSMFYYNVKDICDKVGPDGFYHTSTKDAPSWGGYTGFGTFRTNVGSYYSQCWNRDMGRAAMDLCELGYINKCTSIADCVFKYERAWADTNQPGLNLLVYKPLLDGHKVPPHIPRVMNSIDTTPTQGCFDNDSYGLTTLFIYNLWKRLPGRDAWLRSHWDDVEALGNWVVWQFDNPALSGATNDVLRTDSESAGGTGYSVYPDFICLDALRGLAQMADSIGRHADANQWRETAARLKKGIGKEYIVDDPKYGRVWTLKHAGWPNRSTVFGPIIILADLQGFEPEDGDPNWRTVTEASYQRLLGMYQVPRVFGYFGTAMGYGQGFVTQTALLLDKMDDAGKMLNWAARLTYDPRYEPYIVPEGCELEPDGRYWHRTGDLGNGVQEAEIVKALRIVIGVDDNHPETLRLFPRMPYGWNEINIQDYPTLVKTGGKQEQIPLAYKLIRSNDGMSIQVTAKKPLPAVELRLGPFQSESKTPRVLLDKHPVDAGYEKSGDSFWVRLSVPQGNTGFAAEVKR